jgi:uncharacterized protein (DUF4415 family)
MAIVRTTSEKIRKLPSKTDWNRIKKINDKDIDFSDLPEATNEQLVHAVRPGHPCVKNKRSVISVRIPKDSVTKLKALGRGWSTRAGDALANMIDKGLL